MWALPPSNLLSPLCGCGRRCPPWRRRPAANGLRWRAGGAAVANCAVRSLRHPWAGDGTQPLPAYVPAEIGVHTVPRRPCGVGNCSAEPGHGSAPHIHALEAHAEDDGRAVQPLLKNLYCLLLPRAGQRGGHLRLGRRSGGHDAGRGSRSTRAAAAFRRT
eukprot:366043-Chlamydomonas_euryale.AAC.8